MLRNFHILTTPLKNASKSLENNRRRDGKRLLFRHAPVVYNVNPAVDPAVIEETPVNRMLWHV